MPQEKLTDLHSVYTETLTLTSVYLERDVIIDVYFPNKVDKPENLSLLIFNDGQDLLKMPFDEILDELTSQNIIEPLFCIGIHCGEERKREYGTAYSADFKQRGDKAGLYNKFLQG
ncbi:MAG TPA: hypothetical protein PKG56_06290, partial [Chitinophagaceae bacterium]|nr:hypothetical protein [Chitinophagaceae bacterium]